MKFSTNTIVEVKLPNFKKPQFGIVRNNVLHLRFLENIYIKELEGNFMIHRFPIKESEETEFKNVFETINYYISENALKKADLSKVKIPKYLKEKGHSYLLYEINKFRKGIRNLDNPWDYQLLIEIKAEMLNREHLKK